MIKLVKGVKLNDCPDRVCEILPQKRIDSGSQPGLNYTFRQLLTASVSQEEKTFKGSTGGEAVLFGVYIARVPNPTTTTASQTLKGLLDKEVVFQAVSVETSKKNLIKPVGYNQNYLHSCSC
ncbi:hypothetical protein J6590_087011 [Homalodisca vitripennis]|nr:hypothetical protein J6590_087011 [Homalodisca vitripennis]